jgi:hypothetical protein
MLQILAAVAVLIFAALFAYGVMAMLQLVRNPLVAVGPRVREEATQTDELPRPPAPPLPPVPQVVRGLPERVYVARRAVADGRDARYHNMQFCGGLPRAGAWRLLDLPAEAAG